MSTQSLSPDVPAPARVLTLGSFAVGRGSDVGPPAPTGSKAFLLLRLVIANGGGPASEDHAMGVLWPDLGREAAHRALLSAVRHLGKTLGESVVTFDAGRIGLARARCWVDAHAFEEAVAIADALPDNAPAGVFTAAASHALALYRGHFLPGEDDNALVADYRERLKTRYTRIALRAGSHWLRKGEPERALEAYRRVLVLDPDSDDANRHLMLALIATGHSAEALSAYSRPPVKGRMP